MRTSALSGPPRWLARGVQRRALRRGWAVGQRVAAPSRSPVRRLREVVPLPLHVRDGRVVLEVDTARTTSVVGFSFDPDGDHPHVVTCRRHLHDGNLTVVDTPLHLLYERYQPRTATQTLPLPEGIGMGPLDTLPPSSHVGKSVWTLTRVGEALARRSGLVEEGNTYFGPVSSSFMEAELRRTTSVLETMRRAGYAPARHPDGYVTGYLLVDASGDYRFVVRDGNHRVAALAALGVGRLDVALMLGHPPVIHEDALSAWTEEGGGRYPAASVRALFDGFYGCAAAQRLGHTHA